MEPLVSIITCCYNGERFVDRWAESLLQQTYGNIEVLFVDDGSTDKSGEKALSYKKLLKKMDIHSSISARKIRALVEQQMLVY